MENQTNDNKNEKNLNSNSKTNLDLSKLKPDMPVVCSNDKQFAQVDHLEGNSLKLNKDDKGVHHYIPLTWIKSIDSKVHIDRPGDQAMKEWSSKPASA